MAEQKRIADKISGLFLELDSISSILSDILRDLDGYRELIVRHAFEGRLTDDWRNKGIHEVEENLKETVDKPGRKPTGPKKALKFNLGELHYPDSWQILALDEVSTNEDSGIKSGPFGSFFKNVVWGEQGQQVYGQEYVIKKNSSPKSCYIPENDRNRFKSYSVNPGDILVSLAGRFPRAIVFPEAAGTGIMNQRLARITPNEKLVGSEFLKYFIESPLVKQLLSPRRTSSRFVGLRFLKSLPIPIPPKSEQDEIVKLLDSLLTTADEVQGQVNDAQAQIVLLRQSVMEWAFSGRLVNQLPDDLPAESILDKIRMKDRSSKSMSRVKTVVRKKRRHRTEDQTKEG